MENDKNIYLTTGLSERLKKQLTLKKIVFWVLIKTDAGGNVFWNSSLIKVKSPKPECARTN